MYDSYYHTESMLKQFPIIKHIYVFRDIVPGLRLPTAKEDVGTSPSAVARISSLDYFVLCSLRLLSPSALLDLLLIIQRLRQRWQELPDIFGAIHVVDKLHLIVPFTYSRYDAAALDCPMGMCVSCPTRYSSFINLCLNFQTGTYTCSFGNQCNVANQEVCKNGGCVQCYECYGSI